MPRKERIREAITSLANPNYLTERAAAGWRMAAIEWEREIPDEAPQTAAWSEDIPYGMQVSAMVRAWWRILPKPKSLSWPST
jgi:hypothetical protein